MRELLSRLEEAKKKVKIMLVDWDSYGDFTFSIDGVFYKGHVDAALLGRIVEKSKRQPGAALKMAKDATDLVRVD